MKTKQVANAAIAVEEGSDQNAIFSRGADVVALARTTLELAKKVQGVESLVQSLYNASMNGDDLLPLVSEYMTARQQDNRGEAPQTDGQESLE